MRVPRLPWPRSFWAGLVCGIALVFLGRWALNESSLPDRLIAPLLMNDSTADAGAIVVLGAGVIGNCVPNLNGMRRVVLGAQLLKTGRAPLLVITGGTGDGNCPVADAMADFARELGVPEDRLVIERESRNTWENGERTAPLLASRHVTRLLLVTDRLHMLRASRVFTRQGFTVEPVAVPIYEGHPDNVSMLEAGLREMAALIYYRLRYGAASAAVAAPVTKNSAAASAPPGGRPVAQEGPEPLAVAHPTGPLVILGASYAGNWPLTDIAGVFVVNAGVAGQQSADVAARFDRDVVSAKPRAVLLWGFINDLFAAQDFAQSSARVRDTYLRMIAACRAQGIEPILATEITLRPDDSLMAFARSTLGWVLGKASYQDQINQQVRELNEWLRDTGRREHLLVLDFQHALAGRDGRRRREFTTEDGSHVTPAGYDALTRYARPLLIRRLRLA